MVFRRIEFFSRGKTAVLNEDALTSIEGTFAVVADGATDKSGWTYGHMTGGELASNTVIFACKDSDLNGVELVSLLNSKIRDKYKKYGILEDIEDPKFRFSCNGLVCVRINGDTIVITQMGDSGFRVNGKDVYVDIKAVDKINSHTRALYIKETGDIEGSRGYIKPLLEKQFEFQNNPNSPLGYGSIDGTYTPAKFIHVYEFPIQEIKTLEMFTDGYFDYPQEVSIDAWEDLHEKIQEEDPDKCIKYLSTKSNDDRTIIILEFGN